MSSAPHILSIGSIDVDVQVRAERWPSPGETLLGHDLLLVGGGKAANVAFLARALGVPACLIGRVGDDQLAEIALAPLRDAGVDITDVAFSPGAHTATSLIVVREEDADKAIILAAGANEAWDAGDLDRIDRAIDRAPRGSVVVVDLEIPPFVARRAIVAAEAAGLPVVLDPSPAGRMDFESFAPLAAITPNPAEAQQLTGIEVTDEASALAAAERLRAHRVATAVVKLGNGGCVVLSDEVCGRVSSPRVEPLDKTGAGDAFAGALAVGLLEGKGGLEAARLAVAAADVAVTGYGSQQAYPDRARLDERLACVTAGRGINLDRDSSSAGR